MIQSSEYEPLDCTKTSRIHMPRLFEKNINDLPNLIPCNKFRTSFPPLSRLILGEIDDIRNL